MKTRRQVIQGGSGNALRFLERENLRPPLLRLGFRKWRPGADHQPCVNAGERIEIIINIAFKGYLVIINSSDSTEEMRVFINNSRLSNSFADCLK